jgi:hypothetical protein
MESPPKEMLAFGCPEVERAVIFPELRYTNISKNDRL